MFLLCRVSTFRGQKVEKNGGRWGITFSLSIELGPMKPHCDLRVVITTAYLKSIVKVYGKIFTALYEGMEFLEISPFN